MIHFTEHMQFHLCITLVIRRIQGQYVFLFYFFQTWIASMPVGIYHVTLSCDCDPKIRYVHIGRTEFGAASLSPKKFARTALDFLMHSIVLVDDLEIPL